MDKEYKTIEEYRERLMQVFRSAGWPKLTVLVAPPTEKDFKNLESMLSMVTDGNN